MKIIKNTQFGEINTSIDGVLYCITQEGIVVSDELAAKLSEQFLHTVAVSEAEPVATVEEIAPVEVEQSPIEDTEVKTEESKVDKE